MVKTITVEEIEAGLQAAGITIDQAKAEFKSLYPEAQNILTGGGSYQLQLQANNLWFGFKAGLMVGANILVKIDYKSAPFVVSEDAVGPLEVRNGVLMNCSTCGRLYMVPHEVDVDAFICPLCPQPEPCPECKGRGMIAEDAEPPYQDEGPVLHTCEACRGSGIANPVEVNA